MQLTKEILNQNSERRRNIEELLRVCLGTFDSSLEFIMFLKHNFFLLTVYFSHCIVNSSIILNFLHRLFAYYRLTLLGISIGKVRYTV